MSNESRTHVFARLAGSVLSVFAATNLIGCSSPLEGDSGSASSLHASLKLETGSYVLPVGGTLTLAPSGGQPPYMYAASSGTCTVGASSGSVTAGSIAEICAIGVTDSAGGSVVASVTVTAAAIVTAAETYTWKAAAYGACLSGTYVVTCGGGTHTRSVTCTNSAGAVVSNSLCTGTAPVAAESCNQATCTRPSGSYQLTCSPVSLTGTTLTENCVSTGGATFTTTLTDWASCQPNSIDNINATLTCHR